MSYARINWKEMAALTVRERKSSWAWNKPEGKSTVRFTPNPVTSGNTLVRV